VWGIRVANDSRVIGTIDLVVRDTTSAGLDYALAQECWGNGYVPEAARAIIKWGFSKLPGLLEIRSGCLSRNQGSRRVFEKLGFTHCATTCVAHPPKFPEPIEGYQFVLERPAVVDDAP
jgi:RimJ/RimL family protein N-acetyltransferase